MIVETIRTLIRLLRENIEENTVLSAGSIVEIAKLPVIILNGPDLTEKKRLMRDAERITAIDLDMNVAVREVPPRWYDIKFDVNISCKGNLDLIETFEEFSRFNQKFPLIKAVNDERERYYSWFWSAMPSAEVSPNISQVYSGRGTLTIYDVEVYSNIRKVYPLIRQINAEFDIGGILSENLEVSE